MNNFARGAVTGALVVGAVMWLKLQAAQQRLNDLEGEIAALKKATPASKQKKVTKA